VVIPDEHGVDWLLKLDVIILIDATCIAPSPAIPPITGNFAERLQLYDAINWIQLVHFLVLDLVKERFLSFPPM